MSNPLRAAADSTPDTLIWAAAVLSDSVNWAQESYYVLLDIREVLNWILALSLGAVGYFFTKFLIDGYDKFVKKRRKNAP
ncbi:hypothetical protein R80B4_01651 [Fibrobacteres bacterium R8-0-B4]